MDTSRASPGPVVQRFWAMPRGLDMAAYIERNGIGCFGVRNRSLRASGEWSEPFGAGLVMIQFA